MTFGVFRSAGSLISRSIHLLSLFVEVSALLFLTFASSSAWIILFTTKCSCPRSPGGLLGARSSPSEELPWLHLGSAPSVCPAVHQPQPPAGSWLQAHPCCWGWRYMALHRALRGNHSCS